MSFIFPTQVRLVWRSQEPRHPVGVRFGAGQAIREVMRADNDVPMQIWQEDPSGLRVLFQGHDGVFCLRFDHPEFARIRAVLDEAIRQEARVWFIAQESDLALLDGLPVDPGTKNGCLAPGSDIT